MSETSYTTQEVQAIVDHARQIFTALFASPHGYEETDKDLAKMSFNAAEAFMAHKTDFVEAAMS